MLPGNFPLILYRGDSRRWEFRFWSDAEKTKAVDLTGVTAKSEIRDRPSGRVIVALDCAVLLPNLVIAQLLAEPSRNLPLPPAGAWDLQLIYASGHVVTVLAGTVTVTANVTNSGPFVVSGESPAQLSNRDSVRPALRLYKGIYLAK